MRKHKRVHNHTTQRLPATILNSEGQYGTLVASFYVFTREARDMAPDSGWYPTSYVCAQSHGFWILIVSFIFTSLHRTTTPVPITSYISIIMDPCRLASHQTSRLNHGEKSITRA
jgi:hypothetical protein